MRQDGVQTANSIVPEASTTQYEYRGYRAVKVVCLVLGVCTVSLELARLAILFAATPTQRPSYTSLPVIFLLIGVVVGLAECLLWWLCSKPFHFFDHASVQTRISVPNEHIDPTQRPRSRSSYDANIQENSMIGEMEPFTPQEPRTYAPLKPPQGEQTVIISPQFKNPPKTVPLPLSGNVVNSQVSAITNSTFLFQNPISGMHCYAVPRGGSDLGASEDRNAFDESKARYALADGVGTSFLPGRWAETLTQHFVQREQDFEGQEDFERWLGGCSDDWYRWVNEQYLPIAREQSGVTDWSRDLERGAGATFIGCSFSRNDLMVKDKTDIHVTAVGDAIFFLVSPSSKPTGNWEHRSFRLTEPEEFGQMTETLGSPTRRITRDWKRVNKKDFPATSKDIIVLATDALAQWIMRYKKDGYDPWSILFAIKDHKVFAKFVNDVRSRGMIEVDDTTVMIIPLSNEHA